ncbi:hypothetical protein JN403_15990 [Pseudomonas sp. 15A4]|uniref:hypothetical protein n=1 Tax=Pseudomonas sp. 15A4 TaxID=2804761 RepID=UPI001968A139|nr:hypothetical protein [Pseudomonas sp. 15A4]QSB18080.1 hypothetical protein JN403_15990 [Pseudomonas sp. 15A4]
MSLIPRRIAGRMTLGILTLLILTAVAIFAVMTLGANPNWWPLAPSRRSSQPAPLPVSWRYH